MKAISFAARTISTSPTVSVTSKRFAGEQANRDLEMVSASHTYLKPGRYIIAIKVIDIFGNDTMTLLPVNVIREECMSTISNRSSPFPFEITNCDLKQWKFVCG